jgi:predicted nucleic acid-binding Zn ribbon protein
MLNEPAKTRRQLNVKDPNRICVICGNPFVANAPMQKTCSEECRKINNAPRRQRFRERHPEAAKTYSANQHAKYPYLWQQQTEKNRVKALTLLGGKCVVCGETNQSWLSIDYIPTQPAPTKYPKHPKWIEDHREDFRVLCANHHNELTVTGKIEGTDITQQEHWMIRTNDKP